MIIQVLSEDADKTQETRIRENAVNFSPPAALEPLAEIEGVDVEDIDITVVKRSSGIGLSLVKGFSWLLGGLSLLTAAGLAAQRLKLRRELKTSDLEVVPRLNLESFMGSWYEIAKFPRSKGDRKVGAMVHYQMVDPLTLKENYIYQERDFDSKIIEASSTLHLVDPDNPARMQKQRAGLFSNPLMMNYWVIEVGAAYEYAVIGSPDRQHLWILSRSQHFSPEKYEAVVHRLKQRGFAVENLVRVPHEGITPGASAKPVIEADIREPGVPEERVSQEP